MGLLDGLVPGNDPRMKRLLRGRISGDERQASHEARNEALGVARENAGITAARAADAGIPTAIAQRLAGRQQQAASTAAGQQFASDRRREVEQAEQGLAQMRAQRGAFMRQLLGKGLQTAGALGSQLGVGSGDEAQAGGGPQGVRSTGGFLSGQGAGGGLGMLGGVAGTAVGGPLGGAVGSQLGGLLGGSATQAPVGGMDTTLGMVDQAMATPGPRPPPTLAQIIGQQAGQVAQGGLAGVGMQGGQLQPGTSDELMRLLLLRGF